MELLPLAQEEESLMDGVLGAVDKGDHGCHAVYVHGEELRPYARDEQMGRTSSKLVDRRFKYAYRTIRKNGMIN